MIEEEEEEEDSFLMKGCSHATIVYAHDCISYCDWRSWCSRKAIYSFLSPNCTNASAYFCVCSLATMGTCDKREEIGGRGGLEGGGMKGYMD